MTREEAINEIKSWDFLEGKEIEAIHTLIPELRESEDERIRKAIFKALSKKEARDVLLAEGVQVSDALAYLEKQKEKSMSATEVLARAGLKPYKDGNQWCILAGDNIQEGICGFGDTIDEALYQFLMEVLEKQKEPEKSIDEDGDFTIYHPLKCNGKYECIPYSFFGSLTSFSNDRDLIDFLRSSFYTEEECEEWIEKQKENIEKEYVFRPLAGTDITVAAKQAIRRANEGDRLVLAFNGAYIPVRKGCNANKIVDIYNAFIEKQQDASKAIEAVERIDKYIDEYVQNAHDMKDSHPDKKYCQGIDDTLTGIAWILQDVYSEEKQKEQKPVKCELEDAFKYYTDAGITISCGDIVAKPKEQKSEDVTGIIYNAISEVCHTGNPKDFAEMNQTVFKVAQRVAEMCQKPAEWNVNDKAFIKDCVRILNENGYVASAERLLSMFPVKPVEWSKEDIEMYAKVLFCFQTLTFPTDKERHEIMSWLKSLRPQQKTEGIMGKSKEIPSNWKPSEEQMKVLKNCAYGTYQNGDGPALRELYEQLKKLM